MCYLWLVEGSAAADSRALSLVKQWLRAPANYLTVHRIDLRKQLISPSLTSLFVYFPIQDPVLYAKKPQVGKNRQAFDCLFCIGKGNSLTPRRASSLFKCRCTCLTLPAMAYVLTSSITHTFERKKPMGTSSSSLFL